jgi:predicted nuclease of predicted toxin-antitoxin system
MRTLQVTRSSLCAKGHDVAWIRDDAPGSSDEDVLARAVTEGCILITFDKDFGALAFHAHLPAKCGIILFRIPAPSASFVANAVVAAIESRTDWAGHFSVVEQK